MLRLECAAKVLRTARKETSSPILNLITGAGESFARQAPRSRGLRMAGLSKTTRDHDEIRRWAEERGGKPSHVKDTGSEEDIGILRIDFPGYSEGRLESITWEQFFEKFDERNLSFVYQEQTAGGERSNFNKLVSSESAGEARGGKGSPSKKSTRTRSAGRKAAKKSATAKTAGSASKRGGSTASKRSGTRTKKVTRKGAKAPAKRTAARKGASKRGRVKKTAAQSGRGTKRASARNKSAAKKASRGRRR